MNDTWVHVAATYDATTNLSRTYIMGAIDSSTLHNHANVTSVSGLNPWIGADNWKYGYGAYLIGGILDGGTVNSGGTGFFRGKLQDLRVYPVALTDAEVLSVVNEKMLIKNLVTTSVGENEITLSWTAPSGVTVNSYFIQQSTDDGVTWTTPSSYSVSGTTLIIEGLTSGTRYALSVAAVSGENPGLSAIINTSTFGGAVLRLYSEDASSVVHDLSASPKTLTLNAGANGTATSIAATTHDGVTRQVINIASVSDNSGYATISGSIFSVGGSHSFCFWVKCLGTSGAGLKHIFDYCPAARGGGGASTFPSHILRARSVTTNSVTVPFGPVVDVVSLGDANTHTHIAVTNSIATDGTITCLTPHNLANGQRVLFESSYNIGSAVVGTPASVSITADTTVYVVTVSSPTTFTVAPVGTGQTTVTPSIGGPFVSAICRDTSTLASAVGSWFHITSVFDAITSTSSLYFTNPPTITPAIATKTLVPRLYKTSSNKTVFGTPTNTTNPLFIGRLSSFTANSSMQINDFRAYEKVLSPQEIAAIVAGNA